MKNSIAAILALAFLGLGSAKAGAVLLNDDDTRAHAKAAKDFENSAKGNSAVSAGPSRHHRKEKKKKSDSTPAKEQKTSPAKTSIADLSSPLRAEGVTPPSPAPPEDSDGGDVGKKAAFYLWMGLFIGLGAFGGAAILGGSMVMTMMGVSLGGMVGAFTGYETKAFADLDSY